MDGLGYLLRLKFLLDQDNLPMPTGIVLDKKMWGDLTHAYPLQENIEQVLGYGTFGGMKVYKEKVKA